MGKTHGQSDVFPSPGAPCPAFSPRLDPHPLPVPPAQPSSCLAVPMPKPSSTLHSCRLIKRPADASADSGG